MSHRSFTHLDALESEAIHIMREVAAECTNPALLFREEKTLLCCFVLQKAFRQGDSRFPSYTLIQNIIFLR